MKFIKRTDIFLIAVVLAGVGGNLALAQENIQPGEAIQSYDELAMEFSEFLGDDSDAVLNSLRNGEDLTFDRDGESVTIENSTGVTSPGESALALGLAQEELGNDPTTAEIAEFLYGEQGVLQERANGAGWGQIYQDRGQNVGDVLSRVRANENAQDNLNGERGIQRSEVPDNNRPELGGNTPPDRPERPTRPEQANIPNDVRPEIADRPSLLSRPERPERPQH